MVIVNYVYAVIRSGDIGTEMKTPVTAIGENGRIRLTHLDMSQEVRSTVTS